MNKLSISGWCKKRSGDAFELWLALQQGASAYKEPFGDRSFFWPSFANTSVQPHVLLKKETQDCFPPNSSRPFGPRLQTRASAPNSIDLSSWPSKLCCVPLRKHPLKTSARHLRTSELRARHSLASQASGFQRLKESHSLTRNLFLRAAKRPWRKLSLRVRLCHHFGKTYNKLETPTESLVVV